jgi:NADP-dependent 3-hydroxy acid dehydrogenase YdfG
MRQINQMVVAITGASAGIGRALAVELHKRGARLALAARRVDKLELLNQELGGGHLVVPCDVANEEDCVGFIKQTHQHFGALDTLACNAGYGLMRTIVETTPEDWQKIMATNVYGTTNCIRAAVPLIVKQELRDRWRGQIMIVSSCLARRSGPDAGAYAATKAAQLSIAEALRLEMAEQHIAVTSVHPIGTLTEFFDQAESRSGRKARRSVGEPTQTPEQVAQRMVKAIERPCVEVWPYAMSRLVFGAATLFPKLTDGMVKRRWQQGVL